MEPRLSSHAANPPAGAVAQTVDRTESADAAARTAQAQADQSAADAAMTKKASAGMAWLLAQTLGYKVFSLFGTIYLTHLIDPEHVGQMTIALGVASFTNFLQQPGLREVLVQRRTRSTQWDHPAFTLSLVMGVVAAGLTIAAAPVAAWVNKSSVVLPLLLILSLAAPCFGAGIVPESLLQSQLRFRALAIIEFLRGCGLLLTQIGVAFYLDRIGHREWGAYALAVPVPCWVLFRCVALWVAAKPVIRWQPRPRLWKFLWTDSVKLFAASFMGMVISQGAMFVLGYTSDDTAVGLYSFAFNLSLITAVMLTQNIASVIFPVMSSMQDDPQRLRHVFLRSGRILNMLAIPLCLLQGAMAEPFIRTVCNPKWAGSVPIMQALSVAMAFVVIWPSSRSLMQAQGRYNLALLMQCVHAALFVSAVVIASRFGQGLAVAIGVATIYAVIGLLDPYVAIRTLGGKFTDILALFTAPSVAGLVGVVAAYAAARRIFPADHEYLGALPGGFTSAYIPQAALTCVAALVLCPLVYRLIMPHEFRELSELVRRALGKITGRLRRR